MQSASHPASIKANLCDDLQRLLQLVADLFHGADLLRQTFFPNLFSDPESLIDESKPWPIIDVINGASDKFAEADKIRNEYLYSLTAAANERDAIRTAIDFAYRVFAHFGRLVWFSPNLSDEAKMRLLIKNLDRTSKAMAGIEPIDWRQLAEDLISQLVRAEQFAAQQEIALDETDREILRECNDAAFSYQELRKLINASRSTIQRRCQKLLHYRYLHREGKQGPVQSTGKFSPPDKK